MLSLSRLHPDKSIKIMIIPNRMTLELFLKLKESKSSNLDLISPFA